MKIILDNAKKFLDSPQWRVCAEILENWLLILTVFNTIKELLFK
ncbi:Uncharacterised protein [[Clostridium] sordellii]|nr:hypothetical protein [Paeniclostridium sordellii]CEO04865.1 Uncharacterised protein [[Clostridium] sordellii] [Paeniclostridium sordellii]